MNEADFQGGNQEIYLKTSLSGFKFLFAASFYALEPARSETVSMGGPIERNKKGKIVKQKGRPEFIWQYKDMVIRHGSENTSVPRGPLDSDSLSLEPVMVSPYIRIQGEKVVIVDAHHSHRWKRDDVIGTKKKL